MPTDALSMSILDRGKEPGPAFVASEDSGAFDTPYDIRGCRDDFAFMILQLSLHNPVGREQMLLPHDAQNHVPADLDSIDT